MVLCIDDIRIGKGILELVRGRVGPSVGFHIGLDGCLDFRVDPQFRGFGINDVGSEETGRIHHIVMGRNRLLGASGKGPCHTDL